MTQLDVSCSSALGKLTKSIQGYIYIHTVHMEEHCVNKCFAQVHSRIYRCCHRARPSAWSASWGCSPPGAPRPVQTLLVLQWNSRWIPWLRVQLHSPEGRSVSSTDTVQQNENASHHDDMHSDDTRMQRSKPRLAFRAQFPQQIVAKRYYSDIEIPWKTFMTEMSWRGTSEVIVWRTPDQVRLPVHVRGL
jgi:hypothetical protein